jgi:hypothetical protein
MKPQQGIFHLASIFILPVLVLGIFFSPYIFLKIILGILLLLLTLLLYKNIR